MAPRGLPVDQYGPPKLASTRQGDEGLFAVIGEKKYRMPVFLEPAASPDGPFNVAVPVGPDAPKRLISATRLLGLFSGKPVPDARLTPQRRARLRQMLRVFDARSCDASHREIAAALFGKHRISGPDWHESSLRYTTLRLVRDASAVVSGGYRELLNPRGSIRNQY
jgi:hypothetical protein